MAGRSYDDLLKEVESLRAANASLRETNESLGKENAALRALIWKLEARIKILERGGGSGPQGAGRLVLPPKTAQCPPKPRGRPPGHEGSTWTPPAEMTAEVVRLPLKCCPDCGGGLTRCRDDQDHLVLDLPEIRPRLIRYRHARGWCRACRRVVRAPNAVDEPPNGHLGTRTLALVASLKTQAGMTFAKIAGLLAGFGMKVTPGALVQAVQRVAECLQPKRDELLVALKASTIVHPDETSWPVSGKLGWLWLAATETIEVSTVEMSRGAAVAHALLGDKRDRTIVRDCYAAYNKVPGTHQLCFAHVLRKARELAAYGHAEAVQFHDDLRGVFREAQIVDEARESLAERAMAGEIRRVERLLAKLASSPSKTPAVVHLKKRLGRDQKGLLTFLRRPGVEPTNNRAERAIRPTVIVRKISGGSRSIEGARAHAVITSVARSHRYLGASLLDVIRSSLCPARLRPALTSILPA